MKIFSSFCRNVKFLVPDSWFTREGPAAITLRLFLLRTEPGIPELCELDRHDPERRLAEMSMTICAASSAESASSVHPELKRNHNRCFFSSVLVVLANVSWRSMSWVVRLLCLCLCLWLLLLFLLFGFILCFLSGFPFPA